jgi:hypothetical protein
MDCFELCFDEGEVGACLTELAQGERIVWHANGRYPKRWLIIHYSPKEHPGKIARSQDVEGH